MPTKARSAARTRIRRETASATHPPTWITPQLAALVKEAPDGPDWLHELKLDGYRMHARLDARRVNILTRRGNDWTVCWAGIEMGPRTGCQRPTCVGYSELRPTHATNLS